MNTSRNPDIPPDIDDTDNDLKAIAKILETIRIILNHYVYKYLIPTEGFEDLKEKATHVLGEPDSTNISRGINGVLNSIIEESKHPSVSGDTENVIRDYNLKTDHLQFESYVLKTTWEHFKEKWKDTYK